jgi:hypothetical protein
MGKVIRATYPAGFSIGVLILVFIISFFLSHQIFEVPFSDLHENKNVYFGMFLVGSAVIIMFLVIWEEILFPIKIREVNGGILFRNHRTKLLTQGLIYLSIPAIYTFIYMEFEVNHIRFFIWALICTVAPILEKLASGINNYNDFLRLTDEEIEYKNNEKEGLFKTQDIYQIAIIKEGVSVKKLQLIFKNSEKEIIDLDEMELDAFYESIYKYVTTHYKDWAIEKQLA